MKNSTLSAPAIPKLGRQETKERYALTRQLQKSLKQAVRGTQWKQVRSNLFRDYGGWFVKIMPIVAIGKFETHLRLHTKPMAIDPVFWQIVELPENIRLPLSFRAIGAWTCHTYPVVEAIRLDAGHDPETLAGLVLDWADEQLSQLGPSWTLDGFISGLQQANNGWNFASLISALIVAGRDHEAVTTCLKRAPLCGGGFSVGSRSFTALALSYLQANSVSDPVKG